MNWSEEKIQDIKRQVKEKIALDSTLKKSLATDPNKTIEEITGLKIPEDIIFNVADFYELDDKDLEAIAAGSCYVNEQITD